MGERFENIELKRHGRGYLMGQHVYIKDKLSRDGNSIYLKCIQHRSCPARATINNFTNRATRNDANHSHDAPDLASLRFRPKLKSASAITGLAKLSVPKVYEHVRAEVLMAEAAEEGRWSSHPR